MITFPSQSKKNNTLPCKNFYLASVFLEYKETRDIDNSRDEWKSSQEVTKCLQVTEIKT